MPDQRNDQATSVARRKMYVGVIGIALLAAGVLGNHLLFEAWFDRSYLGLWFEQGPLIALSMTFISLVWDDLDQQVPELISAHPAKFLIGCFMILSGLFLAMIISIPSRSTRAVAQT